MILLLSVAVISFFIYALISLKNIFTLSTVVVIRIIPLKWARTYDNQIFVVPEEVVMCRFDRSVLQSW